MARVENSGSRYGKEVGAILLAICTLHNDDQGACVQQPTDGTRFSSIFIQGEPMAKRKGPVKKPRYKIGQKVFFRPWKMRHSTGMHVFAGTITEACPYFGPNYAYEIKTSRGNKFFNVYEDEMSLSPKRLVKAANEMVDKELGSYARIYAATMKENNRMLKRKLK
jgi:hypothetical protein